MSYSNSNELFIKKETASLANRFYLRLRRACALFAST